MTSPASQVAGDFLLARAGGRVVAMALGQVEAVALLPPAVRLPLSPVGLAGVVPWRAGVAVVLDGAAWLPGWPSRPGAGLALLWPSPWGTLAWPVERADEVVAARQSMPYGGAGSTPWLTALAAFGPAEASVLAPVLDVARLAEAAATAWQASPAFAGKTP